MGTFPNKLGCGGAETECGEYCEIKAQHPKKKPTTICQESKEVNKLYLKSGASG